MNIRGQKSLKFFSQPNDSRSCGQRNESSNAFDWKTQRSRRDQASLVSSKWPKAVDCKI